MNGTLTTITRPATFVRSFARVVTRCWVSLKTPPKSLKLALSTFAITAREFLFGKWAPCQHRNPTDPNQAPLHATDLVAGGWWPRTKHQRHLALEIGAFCLVLYGVAAWSIPCALILGGLAIVVAMEVRD
jgi:hypothetical protein